MSEEATTFPAYPSVCTICGALFDPRAGDHRHGPVALIAGKEVEWTGKPPTYDELALAVLAYDRALHGASGNALGFDQRTLYEAGDTLRNLARRLEPGP
jgi:hypothetical protein